MNLLEIQGVTKTFDKNVAVNNVSLVIPDRCIFGLLGPNGAGKTTLIRMITNIIAPDAGNITLAGETRPQERMYKIGYMPEERGLYKKMKVGEQLMYLAQLKNLSKSVAKEKVDFWLKRFEIESWWNKKVEELSKGMQQKIQFISTVIHEPSLIILDEPFSGLDPVNSNLIRNEIYELRERGATIIFSTHRMEQVEQVCEEIALIHKGNKILEGSVDEIKNRFKENIFRIEFSGELPELPEVSEVSEMPFRTYDRKESEITLQLLDQHSPNDILRFFVEKGTEIRSFNEILPSINEIFINQVGGQSDE